MVGLTAEPAPAGFGFSDTAFRIFILMASRRLQSDRFLTVDFRPEIYSPFGIDWIANNGMTSLILRHCPDLASMLPRYGQCVRAVAADPAGQPATGKHGERIMTTPVGTASIQPEAGAAALDRPCRPRRTARQAAG